MFLINRGTSEFQKVKSQYITKIIFFFFNFFCGKRLQVQRQTIVAVCAIRAQHLTVADVTDFTQDGIS